jgi:tRNA (cmo5U34)-methyltransferase
MKDTIFADSEAEGYSYSHGKIPSFAFNEKVAAVFDDMVIRSIPGYSLAQYLSSKLALQVITKHTNVYDLGCSTATTLIKIAQELDHNRFDASTVRLIGIDSSPDMLSRARQKLDAFSMNGKITLLEEDICNFQLENASLIMSHYTLQFISPEERIKILHAIYTALIPGSCFIFSEKIKHNSPLSESILTKEYYEFKKGNGYSETENMRKRQALENVLQPNTLDDNIALLKKAGFSTIELLHKELCFCTLIAWKHTKQD